MDPDQISKEAFLQNTENNTIVPKYASDCIYNHLLIDYKFYNLIVDFLKCSLIQRQASS